MIQSTSFAQVATNLLNVLQGYTKGIRFVVVLTMLLTIGIGQAWGADYELVTSAPSDWSGEYLIVAGTSALSGGTSSWGTTTAVTVTNDKISTTANISVTISKGVTSGTYYIYMNSNSKYLKEVTSNTFATADAGSADTEWKISLSNGNAQIACASSTTRYLRLNGTSGYRCYTSATGTLPKLYKKVASCTDPTSVSISGEWGYFAGETISLKANPTGGGTPTGYQWYKNGTAISGATSSTYSKSNCTDSDAGNYTCKVSTGATCSTTSSAFVLRVYSLQNYTGGTTTHNFTRVGTTKTGTVEVVLTNNKQYEFKIFAGNSLYLGNNGTINADISNWVFETNTNNAKLNSGLGGTFIFTIDYSSDSSKPKISVSYPRKTIYMNCGNTSWCDSDPAFFAHTWGNVDYDVKLTQHPCDETVYLAEDIPAYNSYIIFTRQKPGSTELVWSDTNFWNQSEDITIGTNDLFTCTGWNNNKGTFSGGTYTPPTYTITFSGNGNTGGSMTNVTGIPCEGSTTLVANGYTRTGYTFNGWKDAGGKTYTNKATISNITSDITLTAQWKENTYTITLDGNNGSGHTASVTATYNSATLSPSTITNPTRAGYTFGGWYSASGGTGSMVIGTDGKLQANVSGYTDANGIWIATASKTLYAQWTPITYYVQFNGNGSTGGSMSNQSFKYGTAQNLTVNAFTRTGYTFAGWTTNDDGSGTSYADKASVNNLSTTNGAIVILYAKWTKVHTITWKVNGQQYGEQQKVVDGQTIGTLPNKPDAPGACSDKEFIGWTESATVNNDGTNITYISTSTIPDGDKTYHAVFATKTTDKSTTTIEKTKTETFENQSASTTYNSTQNYTAANSNAGIAWKIYYGTVSTNAVITGSKSAHMRWYDSAPSNLPYIQSTTLVKGLKSISFATLTSDNAYKYSVSYSTNGTSWTSVATGQQVGSTSTKQTKSYTINNNGVDAYIKIAITSNSDLTDKATFRVDDVTFTYLESTTTTTTTYTDYVTECIPQYTITLNPNGGTFASTPTGWTKDGTNYTITVNEGTQVYLPEPTHANNLDFVGWNDGTTNHTGNYTPTNNVTLTAQWQCVAPKSVTVDGTYHFFPGETITITATPTGGSTPYTYQWQKLVVDAWTDIDQATTATYTKANATKEDVGHYRCVVSSGNSCTTTSNQYNVKCLQLYVYYNDHTDNFNLPLTKLDATTATASVNLVNQNYTYKFKLTDGCENWYGNTGTMTSGDCTNWEMNANEYCGLTTTKYGDYLFTVDYSNLALLKVSVTYPSGNQEAGKVIYWDNHDLQWPDGKIYYRIGHSTHNGKIAMTKVPGTANLYQVTTIEYAGFEAWHIANNGCWSEDNSLYKTNTGDEWAATAATAFITNPVTSAAVTVTAANLHSTGREEQNNNCEFYQYNIADGMKTHKATVIPATGGTITVSYTDHDGTAKSDFTSGDRDLAHTCLLTITATPDAGYKLTSLTVNDVPFTSGNVHTLSADAEIEVVWEKKIETSLSWSADSYTATIASESNKFPTLTVAPETIKESVTYSSSDETVATIDAAGNIRLLAAGTTTIRAYYEEDDTYAAAEDTYELIVKKSTNCRWEEVTIDDIEYGDEVVVAMAHGETLYALPYDKDKASNSNPEATPITQTDFADIIANEVIWYIMKGEGNIFTLSPKTATDKYLTCNSSDNAVRINTGENKNFTIDNDFLKNTRFGTYLAISTAAPKDWRHYSSTNTTIVNKAQTLKFYKKVCLPENEYWVNYNLTNVTCTTTPKVETITSTSEGFTLSFAAADGYILTDAIEIQMEGGALVTDWDDDNGILTINKPDGGFTGNITISIAACLSLPAPENLAANEITSSSVTLSWDAVADAQSYEVLVLDKNNDEISKTTTECQITLTDLQVNSYYVWGVTPVADGFCGIQETSDFTTLQSYVVTFDNNGHSQAEFMPETQTIDHGTLVQEPDDDPTDNGYSFAGWYDNKECSGEAFNFLETPITGTTTLYAKWDVVTYIITYAGLEGAENNANNPTTYTIETPTITFLAPSTRDGYIFSGWSPATLETGNYGEKTITAIWEKGKIVTWEADGKVVTSQTYASGDALVLPTEEIEACQGSVFVGWTADPNYSHPTDAPDFVAAGGEVNADATYYAVYAEETEGDEIILAIGAETDNTNGNATYAYAIEVEGFSLVANKGAGQTNPTFNESNNDARIYAKGSITLTAPKNLTSIVFNLSTQGKKRLAPISASVGAIATQASGDAIVVWTGNASEVTFTVGEKANYGSDDSSNAGQLCFENIVVTSESSYTNYSTSCIPTYHVNYELAGGENGCADEGVKVGNDYIICGDKPTKTGYTFQGWNDGTAIYAAGATIANVQSDITLTAVWEANTYTITWMSNGEEYIATTHTYDQELELPADPYTCYGAKTFVGWTEDETVNEDGSDITFIDENTNSSEDKIYYAVFADETNNGSGGYDKVTEALDDYSGEYLIVYEAGNKAFNGGLSTLDATNNGIDVTINNNIIESNQTTDAAKFTIAAINDGYSIKSASGKYIGRTANENDLDESTSTIYTNTISINNDKSINIIGSGNAYLRYNTDGSRFRYYKSSTYSSQQVIALYKKSAGATLTKYTTTPSGCAEMEVAENAYVTSAKDQRVKVNVPIAVNFQDGYTIDATLNDGTKFEVVEVSEIVDDKAIVTLAYSPDYSNNTETAEVKLTAKYGENFVTAKSFNLNGRSLPENFVIAAKWDGHWYALPANCTSSLSSTEGLLIEVDDVDNPTRATQAPASAKYGIREVIPSRQTDHGQGVVFTERYSNDNKEYSLYNGTSTNLQVYAQYSNYAQTNPDKYEWIPTTSDFNEYTVTNASTGRNLGLTSGSFGAYTAASNQVRLLPATFYEPAPVQVLKWKANSVIVMYTGAEATATTQVGNNDASDKQTLADQKITHGIYELTTNQALTSNAGGVLKLDFGANTRVELEIPLIISGDVTASANAHDVVILENSKLTAAATKYSYKDVYVYGGGKLAIPDGTKLGVNNIILRAGAISTNGAGLGATYQYIYPQVELKGILTSSVQNIRYEYVTDYDHWYHLALPFDGSLASIHYPYEYYGDQVKLDNTGSWQIKRYAGEIRATGNYDAWKDIEKDEPKATTVTAGKGYIYWGAPKKITANDVYDRPTWGIQRITMSVSAPAAKTAENGDKTISGLGSYETVANNSGAVNDQGWNLIGNPYMVNLTTMAEDGLKAGKLVEEIVDGNWTGKWINNGDGIRYLTIPSNHFDTYEAKTVNAAITASNLVPGRAFFVQLEGEANGVAFAAANRASLMPQHLAAQNKEVAVETGIVLINETMQDEVNFWIKDGKTNDYEYNADYPKTPNNTNFNIYGVHINGNLSWVATGPEYAEESMPIGYQVPAAGTYTLSISETYYSDFLDALYVTDHAMSPEVTVDLMAAPYEFSVNQAETNNERFTISVKLKSESQGPTTGLENTGVQRDGTIKFIYQDKIFILHHGKIYDATGKQITTINK